MMFKPWQSVVLFLAVSLSLGNPANASAEDIEGKVVEVQGKLVTISTSSDLLPVTGDPLEVVEKIPGLDDVASVGSGRVSRVESGKIFATIDQSTSEVRIGQLARIVSKTPVKRMTRPSQPANPTTRSNDVTPKSVDVPTQLKGETEETRQIVRAVAAVLPKKHISRHPLDDEIARRTMKLLFDRLDPRKQFFNSADVRRFKHVEEDLDEELRAGDLSTVYELIRLLQSRVEQRWPLIEEFLEQTHDFTIDENFTLSPDELSFCPDDREIRDRWRKLVKHQLLVHLAAGNDADNANRLARRFFRNQVHGVRQMSDKDVLSITLEVLADAYDPQSNYLSPTVYEEFRVQLQQSLVGIGVALSSSDGYLHVAKVIPGGPADRAGQLQAGDRIIAVGEADGTMTDIVGMNMRDIVPLIRGESGTTVRLRVLPRGKFVAQMYSITRDTIDFVNMASTVLTGEDLPSQRSSRVGYIYLPTFYRQLNSNNQTVRSTTKDVQHILDGFRRDRVDVVLLDLRDNAGGTLNEALTLSGLFVGNGVVLQSKDADGDIQQYNTAQARIEWQKPLVVLTNRLTGGGGEIVAGAIQDYRRGLIIGDPSTSGNGTIQDFFDVAKENSDETKLGQFGHLRVTNRQFYLASGRSTQRRGVVPDITLPSATSSRPRVSDQPYSLDYDDVPAANLDPSNRSLNKDTLKRLVTQSEERRRTSKYFQELAAPPQETVVSLNQEKFLAATRAPLSEEATKRVPGVAAVTMDEYFNEVLRLTLEYANERR